MDSELNMVAIVLGCIFVPLGGILLWIFIKNQKVIIAKHITETKRIYRGHLQKVHALLNVKEIKSFKDLSDEDVDKLISISKDEWQEWDDLLMKASVLANAKQSLFYDYIDEFYPDIRSRKSYKSSSERKYAIINSLTLDELRDLCSEKESSWNRRATIIEKLKDIEEKYPEGLNYFRSKNQYSSKSDIVKNLKLIQNYQSLFDQNKRYLKWEEKQKKFCKEYHKRIQEFRKSDGRYTYKFQIKEPQPDGSFIDKKVEVWQGFVQQYVQYQLAKITNSFLDGLIKLPEFKSKSRFFYDHVYDDIKRIIDEYFKESSTLVIFITKNKYQWDEDVYEYHYRKLKNRLGDDDIDFCDLEKLPQYCSKGTQYEYVIIFDLITTNDELINNCVLVSNFFSDNLPCIGYYSLLKEYSFEELKDFKKEESILLTKSKYQKELDYIKDLFKQVDKDPEFTWFAVTNTIIGDAIDSENVKSSWLTDADQYRVESQLLDGFISVTYNTPDSPPDSEFTLIGDLYSLDDVARFTYELLTIMDIYDQFKENGSIAIEVINNNEYLSHY